MTEYEKLTVVKLRDELATRGLPKTGLKAALVQRLVEADAGDAGRLSEERVQDQPFEDLGSAELAQKAASPDAHAQDEVKAGQPQEHVNVGAQQLGHPDEYPSKPADAQEENGPLRTVEDGPPSEDVSAHLTSEASASGAINENFAIPEDLPDGVPVEYQAQSPKIPEVSLQLSNLVQTQPNKSQAVESIAMTSVTGEEMLDDSRKRKRRSQSPPPSSIENMQKKSKAADTRPHVELPEDFAPQDAQREEGSSGITSKPHATRALPDEARTDDNVDVGSQITISATGTVGKKSQPDAVDTVRPPNGAEGTIATPAHANSAESSMKLSPTNSRFRDLLPVPPEADFPFKTPHYADTEERVIEPALHPATSALYIRELMRPLKPENLKDYLTVLGTPRDSSDNSDIVTEFFLDSIRTHCLVRFANISAASRARSALHEKIWPNERDRRRLWVDFVPEEKLKLWIDVEQKAASGRGQASKRWEVVYEKEDEGVKAYLQEVGSNRGGLRAVVPPSIDTGQGVQGAPSGPRIKEEPLRASQSKIDNGKGFQALDDLFKSTAAKPKLYYLPVSQSEADRRLEKLATARGGGQGDEMRRFSFEEGSVVDKGPEFGNRGRGGFGGRGGASRGKGGGYRSDVPHVDSWRHSGHRDA